MAFKIRVIFYQQFSVIIGKYRPQITSVYGMVNNPSLIMAITSKLSEQSPNLCDESVENPLLVYLEIYNIPELTTVTLLCSITPKYSSCLNVMLSFTIFLLGVPG
jgi:hypothetical protein